MQEYIGVYHCSVNHIYMKLIRTNLCFANHAKKLTCVIPKLGSCHFYITECELT